MVAASLAERALMAELPSYDFDVPPRGFESMFTDLRL
jgi:hypothetical protein